MVALSRRRPSKTAFQLRISLMEVTPTIWRRLLVPGEVKLSRLHTIFRAAMGWEDHHLHYFEIDSVRHGSPDPDWENYDIDEETVRLRDLVSGRARCFHEHDFGDSWRHEVVVESMDPVPAILKFAVCVDGRRACPPEDCGGTGGYQDLARPSATPTAKSTPTTPSGLACSTLSSSSWPSPTLLSNGCAESRALRRCDPQ
jgi:hypothetical protein